MEWLLNLLGGGSDKPGATSKNLSQAGSAATGSGILGLLESNSGTPAPGQSSMATDQNQLNSILAMMRGLGGL